MAVWLQLLGAIVGPTALAYALIALTRAGRRAAERRRERRAPPTALPVERLRADLRRLRVQLDRTEEQPPAVGKAVRTKAARDAYLDVLRAACAELDVDPPRQRSGRSLRAEIYRVEAALRMRGLDT